MDIIRQLFFDLLAVFNTFKFKDIIDILVITFIVFSLFRLIRETRAEQLLKGIFVLLFVYILSRSFTLSMLSSLLNQLFEFGVIVFVIIFQPEIRKALEQIGRSKLHIKSLNLVSRSMRTDEWVELEKKAIKASVDSAIIFSRSKTGALIVFELDTMLSDIAATGTILNSDPSTALLGNIFFNKAPLHDGAIIIRNGQILAAGCILPLSKNPYISPDLGTRHRAAIGISEESDAVVLVVSEETGTISLAIKGIIKKLQDKESLLNEMMKSILPLQKEKSRFPFKSIFKEKNNEKK